MFDIDHWLAEMTEKLCAVFGDRLLFLGLQGSFQRGEATDHSDIDLVSVLDTVSAADLLAYRGVVAAMPDGERACGFLSGREELAGWPRYDLFQLVRDTRPLIGSLEGLVPPTGPADAAEAVRIGAANLYHAACHSALYDRDPAAALPGLYKGAFFILQARTYCRTGVYAGSRRALLPLLEGADRRMLETDGKRARMKDWSPAALAEARQTLLDWCGGLLRGRQDG